MQEITKKTDPNTIIFGGTFNPIHNGHVFIVEQITQLFEQSKSNLLLNILPNNIPPHKNNIGLTQQNSTTPTPRSSRGASGMHEPYNIISNNQHRLNLIKLALDKYIKTNQVVINTCELERTGPSYMAETIEDFNSNTNIWLILGLDSFSSLPTWHRPNDIINNTNFIIIQRELENLGDKLQNWALEYINQHQISYEEFCQYIKISNKKANNISGKVFRLNNPMVDISATHIRELINKYYLADNQINKKNILTNLEKLVPKSVINYIIEHNLYTNN